MNISLPAWIQSPNKYRKRLVAHAHRYGRSRVASRLLHRFTELPLIHRALQWHLREIFTVQTIELKVPSRIPSNYQIRVATPADHASVEAYYGDVDRVRQRFERSDKCLIACCRDQIGAAAWFMPGPSNYCEDWDSMRCRFVLPERSVWSYDGKGTKFGAWGTLMAKLPEHLQNWGVERVFTAIDYHNGESLRGHEKLGYQRIGMIRRVMLSGVSQTVCKNVGEGWNHLPAALGRMQLIR